MIAILLVISQYILGLLLDIGFLDEQLEIMRSVGIIGGIVVVVVWILYDLNKKRKINKKS